MDSFLSFASGRRSIRKWSDAPVPREDIEYMINCAVAAPSGCNSQCWAFVAVKRDAVKEQLAAAAEDAVDAFYSGTGFDAQYIESRKRAVTFFRKAPLVIAVFMTGLTFYDPKTTEIYESRGYGHDGMMAALGYPDTLSVGAAVQNLLLAAYEKGYGACWMNDPAIAGERMNAVLGVPKENRFLSLVPVGVPAYTPREKPQKALNEVLRVIE